MSTFEIKAYRVEVEPHPDADRLDIIRCEGQQFICIAQKGLYQTGDVALYIPTDAIVPECLLKPGFWDEAKGKGLLSGSLGNRVKPKRLRGVFSEGILFKCKLDPDKNDGTWLFNYKLGEDYCQYEFKLDKNDDAAALLGIIKYEPIIPANMRSRVIGAFMDITMKYDFESIKKETNMFYDYEVKEEIAVAENGLEFVKKNRTIKYDQPDEVWISEKVHGTLCMSGIAATEFRNEKFYKDAIYFSSKGFGARGIVLDHEDEENVYVCALKKYNLFEKLLEIEYLARDRSLLLFSEVFGSGVQDLTYGASSGDLFLRVFDAAYVRRHDDYTFLEFDALVEICKMLAVPMVPILYRGPFDPQIVAQLTDGLETVSGNSAHIREGVVVKTTKNFLDVSSNRFYRKVAKSVSEQYHERKGNQTDFQ